MPTLTNIPSTLTAELIDRLGRLWGQPEGVAEVALSTLSYGSRASLRSHKLVEPVATKGDAAVEISITDVGWDIIQACAELRCDRRDEERNEREATAAESRLRRAHLKWESGSVERHVSTDSRPKHGSGAVPSTLAPDLVDWLAHLRGQPDGVAEVALSALPYISRGELVDHGVIEPAATAADGAVEIGITDYGWDLIEACAEECHDGAELDSQGQDHAEAQLQRAYENHKAGVDSRWRATQAGASTWHASSEASPKGAPCWLPPGSS
jgi:hypothetical protein